MRANVELVFLLQDQKDVLENFNEKGIYKKITILLSCSEASLAFSFLARVQI